MYSYGYQRGGSYGVRNVFVGSRFQRGSGIGSFLGGLFRGSLPYLGRGLRAVGREVLSGGINVLHDLDDEKTNLKESVKNRYRETRDNLERKAKEKIMSMMTGSERHHRLASGNLYGPLISSTAGPDFQSRNIRAIESIAGPAYRKKKKRRRRKQKAIRKSSSRKKSGKKKQKKTKKRKKKQKRRKRKQSRRESNDIFD